MEDKKYTLTELLNLRCAETDNVIENGEVVRLYNWGRTRYLLGYGAYVWDKQEKGFILQMNETLNRYYGHENYGIDDRYDLFRTTPEKLNKEELEILNQ